MEVVSQTIVAKDKKGMQFTLTPAEGAESEQLSKLWDCIHNCQFGRRSFTKLADGSIAITLYDK